MPQENVEVVRRSFEVFNRDGLEAAFRGGFLSPEVVVDLSGAGVPGLGVYTATPREPSRPPGCRSRR